MIKGELLDGKFKIDSGKITGDKFLVDILNELREPPFGPSEGDPDLALFDRLRDTLQGTKLLSYKPMEIDSDVTY